MPPTQKAPRNLMCTVVGLLSRMTAVRKPYYHRTENQYGHCSGISCGEWGCMVANQCETSPRNRTKRAITLLKPNLVLWAMERLDVDRVAIPSPSVDLILLFCIFVTMKMSPSTKGVRLWCRSSWLFALLGRYILGLCSTGGSTCRQLG